MLTVLPPGVMNASMWCLPTNVQKEWCVGFYYRSDQESNKFQRQEPLIMQHDVDTDISLTYLSIFFNKSTNSFVVLITYL